MAAHSRFDTIAQDAFNEAKRTLQGSKTSPDALQIVIDGTTAIEDVQDAIQRALSYYETRLDSSGKTRKWLQRSSELICHYGTILDVFVQHHPEYVSLVWGAMKFLFISAVNHCETLKIIAKSIAEVALCLPSIRKLSKLYPSTEMKTVIETLYSHILEFLQKAYQWLTESRFKHLVHSLIRPPELVYSDVLASITQASARVTELASIETQLEIREMHEGQRDNMMQITRVVENSDLARKDEIELLRLSVARMQTSQLQQETQLAQLIEMLSTTGSSVNNVLAKVESSHAIHTSALINTNLHLSQLEQLHVLSSMPLSYEDPDKSLQRHSLLRRRRVRTFSDRPATSDIWLSPKLRRTVSSSSSALITIRGPFSTRWAIQDFGVDMIQMLSSPSIPAIILWALTGDAHSGSGTASWNTVDVLKYLTWQALRASAAATTGGTYYTERDTSIRYSRFYTTRTDEDWLGFFAETVASLLVQRQQVFVVIDTAAINTFWDDDERGGRAGQSFNLIYALNRLVKQKGGPSLKIILLVYTPAWSGQISGSVMESVVQVKAAKAKPTKGSRAQQQGKFKKGLKCAMIAVDE